MAKKSKNDVPNPNTVANRDILQRLNFLYQASTYLNSLDAGPSPIPPPHAPVEDKIPSVSNAAFIPAELDPRPSKKAKRREENRRRHPTTFTDLSRSYIRSMKTIGTKTNVRIDPSVKRTLCKGCNIVLIPGNTATVRLKPSPVHGHVMTYSCLACKYVRRIPAPPVLQEHSEHGAVEGEGNGDGGIASAAQPNPGTEVGQTFQEVKEGNNMDVDVDADASALATSGGTASHRGRKRRKRRPVVMAKPLPLFQQKGHVIFRGNEKVELAE